MKAYRSFKISIFLSHIFLWFSLFSVSVKGYIFLPCRSEALESHAQNETLEALESEYLKVLSLVELYKTKNDPSLLHSAEAMLDKLMTGISDDGFSIIKDKFVYLKGIILYHSGKYDKVKGIFNEIDRTSFYADEVLFLVIWSFIQMDQLEEALKEIDLFIKLYPYSLHFYEVVILNGMVIKRQGRVDEAVKVYESAKAILLNDNERLNKILETDTSLREIASFFEYISHTSIYISPISNMDVVIKRLLHRLSINKETHEHLLRTITLLNLLDHIDTITIKAVNMLNQTEYSISYYENLIANIYGLLKDISKLDVKAIEEEVKLESIKKDVRYFATETEQILLNNIDTILDSINKFDKYLQKTKRLLIASIEDPYTYTNEIHPTMLKSPLLYQNPISSLGKIQAGNNVNGPLDNYVTFISQKVNILSAINQEVDESLWNIWSNIAMGKDWKGDMGSTSDMVGKAQFLLKQIEEDIKNRKETLYDELFLTIAARKKEFLSLLDERAKKVKDLTDTSKRMIKHIELNRDETNAHKESIYAIQKRIREMARQILYQLNISREIFREYLQVEIRREIKNTNEMIGTIDFEIGNILFDIIKK